MKISLYSEQVGYPEGVDVLFTPYRVDLETQPKIERSSGRLRLGGWPVGLSKKLSGARPHPVCLRHVGLRGLGQESAAVGPRDEAVAHEARDVLGDLAHVRAVARIQIEELGLGEWDLVSGDEAERGAGRARIPRTRRHVEERGAKASGYVAEGIEHRLAVLHDDWIAMRRRNASFDPFLEVPQERVEEDMAREAATRSLVAVHGWHRPACLDNVRRRS